MAGRGVAGRGGRLCAVVPHALRGVLQGGALFVEQQLAPTRRAELLQASGGALRQALVHRAQFGDPRRLDAPLDCGELRGAQAQSKAA